MPNGRTRSDQLRTVFRETQERAEQDIAAIQKEAEQRIIAAKKEVVKAAAFGVMGAFLDPDLNTGQKKRRMEKYVDETA
jgi:hypothetical protein